MTVSEQNTLKQIRQRKKEEIHKIFPRRPLHASLEESEEDECLIEWLQQKRIAAPKFLATAIQTAVLEELLEELEQ